MKTSLICAMNRYTFEQINKSNFVVCYQGEIIEYITDSTYEYAENRFDKIARGK